MLQWGDMLRVALYIHFNEHIVNNMKEKIRLIRRPIPLPETKAISMDSCASFALAITTTALTLQIVFHTLQTIVYYSYCNNIWL